MWDQLGKNDGTFGHLDAYLGETGFERAVVFAPFRQWFEGDPNKWLLDGVEGKEKFIPFITINDVATALSDLRVGIQRGAKGVKFHPAITKIAVDEPGLEAFYSLAEEMRMPVLIHTGPHGWFLSKYRPALVDEVARRHPRLPLVIEHLGGAGLARETFAVMQNSPNTYGGLATCLTGDSGWFVPTDEVAFMIKKFGADRFIFGSDFPWNPAENTRKAKEVLRDLKMPRVDLELVLSGNMERLVSSVGKE
jgi:predicted TIM-barrel fold metal-dependent hydrolase